MMKLVKGKLITFREGKCPIKKYDVIHKNSAAVKMKSLKKCQNIRVGRIGG